MSERINIRGGDIPLSQLIPLKKRNVTDRALKKLRSSIMAVGIIEPLCVSPCEGGFHILDGYIRYEVLLELGIEKVPCMIYDTPDLYTMNRQVNHISPLQEARMLRKALEKIDEKTIASAFGMKSIRYRIDTSLAKKLHEDVVAAYDNGTISKRCASELSHVTPKRQKEILMLMFEIENFSLDIIRAQILKTPEPERQLQKKKSPWKTNEENKKTIGDQLKIIEEEHDFYAGLYRQYVSDLTRIVIHVRAMLSKDELKEALEILEPEIYKFFQDLIANECDFEEE